MPKTGSITINTTTVIDRHMYQVFLSELMSNGWIVDTNNTIIFMIDGTYELESVIAEKFDRVIEKINKSIEQKKETSIELIWEGNSIGIYFFYIDENTLMITCNIDDKRIDMMEIVDFTWYIEKLKPVINMLHFYRITCLYD